jgi:hypothetical protein
MNLASIFRVLLLAGSLAATGAVAAGAPEAAPAPGDEPAAPGARELAAVADPAGGSVRLPDVQVPRAVLIEGERVPLRGAGSLNFLGFHVYDAAFYVPDSARGEAVLGPVPKRLLLHYRRTIEAAKIVTASEKALRGNPGLDLAALRERLDRIHAAFRTVHKGDEYELIYHPAAGTTLRRNGTAVCVLPGDDFAAAYFGIWVSDHALNPRFMRVLRGDARP